MTDTDKKISVIIPVHNRTRYLDATLESVDGQTHTNVEVILINDGSGPEVSPVLLGLCRRYPFVQMLELDEHYGVSYARNKGIERATGGYIHLLDDDDKIAPDFYERSLEGLKKADVSIAEAELFSENETSGSFEKQQKVFNHFYEFSGSKPVDHWSYFLVYSPPIHAMVFKKDVFNEVKFNESLTYGEDRYLWLQLKDRGVRFEKLNYSGVFYRVGDKHSAKKNRYRKQLIFFKKVLGSGLVKTKTGRSYVCTFLFLLVIKTGAISRIFRYGSLALQTPFLFLKHMRFLAKYR